MEKKRSDNGANVDGIFGLSKSVEEGSIKYADCIERCKIKVIPGDTLAGIAERQFRNVNLQTLIADVNLGRTRQDMLDGKRIVRIKLGQQIVLPLPHEIVQFCSDRLDVRAQPIITIVEVDKPDQQSVDAQLGMILSAHHITIS